MADIKLNDSYHYTPVGGAVRRCYSTRHSRWARVGTILLSIVAFLSAWATYMQFAVGLTAVTIPALLLVVVMLLAAASRKIRARVAEADFFVLAFYLVILLSVVWSMARDAWVAHAFWYTICIVIYFSTRFFARTGENLKVIAYGVLLGILASGLMTKNQINEWGVASARQSIEGVNSNFTAYVLAGSVYLVAISRQSRVLNGKWVNLVAAALMLFAAVKIFDLGTRGAIISVALMACWRLVSAAIPRRGVLLLTLAAFIVSGLISLGVMDQLLLLFEGLSTRSTSDLSGRLEVWPIARSTLSSFYVFAGIGAGAFAATNPLGIGAHNVFLSILLDAGVFGLFFFIMFILALFRPAYSRDGVRGAGYVLGLFVCFWIPIALSGVWEAAPFSWLLLGFTYNLLRLENER